MLSESASVAKARKPAKSPPVIRPPVKWHGGKGMLYPEIIATFPEHRTYVEPYGGAASVLLNKPPSPVEVYNDLDENLFNLFQVLRDHPEELGRKLILTLYSEAEFLASFEPTNDPIEAARRFVVRYRMSQGGRGENFSFTTHRVRRDMAEVVSAFLSAVDDEIPKIAARLRTVQIMGRPAIEVIQGWDSPGTLFYLDPTYVHVTRNASATDVYALEMRDEDHRELAAVLHQIQGKAVLSGYDCELYKELFAGWPSVQWESAIHSGHGEEKRRTIETLWFNWPADLTSFNRIREKKRKRAEEERKRAEEKRKRAEEERKRVDKALQG